MQLKDIIQKTTQFLRDKGSPTARLDTELLISSALNWDRIKLYLNYEYPLKEEELIKCREFVKRRASGEPVAYILGRKDFYKHSFKVSSAVLIPRPETETLVEQAIMFSQQNHDASENSDTKLRVIDLGVGSGCVGLSVLAEIPNAELLGVDISPEAIEVAKENAASLELQERARFLLRDAGVLDLKTVVVELGGPADILLANPPYIDPADPMIEANVRKFEPSQALFSEEQGLRHIRTWAKAADSILRPGGMIMFEIGQGQADAAMEIFEEAGCYQDLQIVKDLADHNRFIRAIRAQEN